MQHFYVYIDYEIKKYLDSCLDEVSGTVGRTELLELYNLATTEPYSLLYINLVSPKHK
jgi:hypothetical protein